MTLLELPSTTPLDASSSIAIGIAGEIVTNDKGQKHVVFIHQNPQPDPWVLHLAWHQKLFHHPWDGRYHWVGLSKIDLELQETFSDWTRIVANGAQDSLIPYSVTFSPNSNFDAAGHFIDRKDGTGLTCSTFILAMFADFSLPLLRTDTWPTSRPGDFTWLRKMLKHLRKVIPKSDFLQQVSRRHQLSRFRPEEVIAAATLFVGAPLTFSEVEPIAKKILLQVPR